MESETLNRSSHPPFATPDTPAAAEFRATAPGEMRVIRRNGKVTAFDSSKIGVAITKAFLAVEGSAAAASRRIHEVVEELTEQVVKALFRRMPSGGTIHIEDIQDQVELALMRGEHHKVARAYVLYRAERARVRAEKAAKQQEPQPQENILHVTLADGTQKPLDFDRLGRIVDEACRGLAEVDGGWILDETRRNLFDGVPEKDVAPALMMAARTRIEQEPNYSYVAARLLLDTLRREALTFLGHGAAEATQDEMRGRYAEYFADFIKRGAELELLSAELPHYDLDRLSAALKPERDLNFNYLGLQTLYDRYFIHYRNTRFELPQAFFMRVAMGLAMGEVDRETKAIEFYDLLSSFDFMSSTPTLFNSGTLRPQLSSCYLTTVPDDLDGIYSAIKDNALLSKYAGGLGNDWTRVRGLGAHIKGTNGKSQGVVPFLKVANDTAVAVNQSFVPGTLLPTNKGVIPIEEITEEHLLLNLFGEFKQVGILKSYNQHDPVVKITTQRCLEPFRVTAGHPIAVIRGIKERESYKRINWDKKIIEWVEAKDLLPTDMIVSRIPEHNFNPWRATPADARMYGIMVGDGHVKSGRNEAGVSLNINTNTQTIEFVTNYLVQAGIHYWTAQDRNCLYINWKASDLPLFSRGTLYDNKKDKIIVGEMLHLPNEWAFELLCGLLETDGYKKKTGGFGYVTKSRKLAEAVRFIATKFKVLATGYRRSIALAKFTQRDGTIITKDNCADVYEVHIPAFDGLAKRFGVNLFEIHQGWYTFRDEYLLDRVVSIENDDYRGMVYDFEMQGQPSYAIANGVVHNGGKRLGAVCAYLETWHLDIEEFLELRKNTGDDRRRTHDMNTANWVPDLFMKRVAEDAQWTLFSPSDAPDLHDLYGAAFEQRYTDYEAKVDRGEITLYKRLPAAQLWRKMLSMLFETGHPWITFKDPCNIRYTNRHAGAVHSSNLCTEITLHTNDNEIAVCNLGSVNLAAHVTDDGVLDVPKLEKTISTAMRMLDNVIDINYYSVPQARRSNLRHRPVGMGVMGFQDALYKLRVPYASQEAVEFADRSMELLSYYAIKASTDLAEERGRYPSYEGSLWSQGILPIDSVALVEQERGGFLQMDRSFTLDWDALRERVKEVGMRNSNTMAIAPTATISNICGVSQSIEPTFQNLFVKSNLSGEFTVVNPYLVAELKKHDLWDAVMINDLKYYDGSVQKIERVPEQIKQMYATAFELDARWLIEAGSRRQKWIDQAQSLNLYMAEPSGKKLDNLYKLAWVRGLKTTYYLRTMGATHVEKSTAFDGKLNAVKSGDDGAALLNMPVASSDVRAESGPKVCLIDDPTCEACQ